MNIRTLILKRLEPPFYEWEKMNEIVKYSPDMYNQEGVCVVDDWISCSEIGDVFNGNILTFEEYMRVEDSFVNVFKDVLIQSGCKYITLFSFNPIKKIRIPRCFCKELRMSTKSILTELGTVETGARYSVEKAALLFRLSLRNTIDCFFINKKKRIQFDVGYDYYVHLYTYLDASALQSIVSRNHLFLNPRG